MLSTRTVNIVIEACRAIVRHAAEQYTWPRHPEC